MYYLPARGRWAVHLVHLATRAPGALADLVTAEQLLVRPEHLDVLPAPHRSTREGRLQAEARELVVMAAAAAAPGGTVGFGKAARADAQGGEAMEVEPAAAEEEVEEVELPADLVVLSLLPHLSRCTMRSDGGRRTITAGELDLAAAVCHSWRAAALALRALAPACARDVAVKLRLQGAGVVQAGQGGVAAGSWDGEYEVWPHGERGQAPMLLYVHNALTAKPTEFVSLPEDEGRQGNFSFFPAGGTARTPQGQPPYVATRFAKLRVCPWTLRAKTDDLTFATTDGASSLSYRYWNGERAATFTEVPFATARDVCGHSNTEMLLTTGAGRGTCGIDLRGTGFGVDLTRFAAMGCGAAGLLLLPAAGVRAANAALAKTPRCVSKGIDAAMLDGQADAWQDHLFIVGGGFAGRCVPRRDTTADEVAAGENFDNEGRNGGWVLELLREEPHKGALLIPVGGPIARPVLRPSEADERGRCVYDHLGGPASTYYVRAVEDYADEPDDFP